MQYCGSIILIWLFSILTDDIVWPSVFSSWWCVVYSFWQYLYTFIWPRYSWECFDPVMMTIHYIQLSLTFVFFFFFIRILIRYSVLKSHSMSYWAVVLHFPFWYLHCYSFCSFDIHFYSFISIHSVVIHSFHFIHLLLLCCCINSMLTVDVSFLFDLCCFLQWLLSDCSTGLRVIFTMSQLWLNFVVWHSHWWWCWYFLQVMTIRYIPDICSSLYEMFDSAALWPWPIPVSLLMVTTLRYLLTVHTMMFICYSIPKYSFLV